MYYNSNWATSYASYPIQVYQFISIEQRSGLICYCRHSKHECCLLVNQLVDSFNPFFSFYFQLLLSAAVHFNTSYGKQKTSPDPLLLWVLK